MITAVSQRTCIYLLEDYNFGILSGIEIGFDETFLTVNESTNDPLEVCARLMDGQLERDATVTVQTVQLFSDYPHEDYIPLSLQLTFTPIVKETCFNITVRDDFFYEIHEIFNVTLTTLDDGVIVNPGVLTITILDDDGMLTQHIHMVMSQT